MLTVLTIARDVDRRLPRGGDAPVCLVREGRNAIGSTDEADDDPGLGGLVPQKHLLIRHECESPRTAAPPASLWPCRCLRRSAPSGPEPSGIGERGRRHANITHGLKATVGAQLPGADRGGGATIFTQVAN